MNVEEIYLFCLEFEGAKEEFPFDDKTMVFKVMGKMFILLPLDKPNTISVKCNPEKAIELRERWQGLNGAFHMNKKHWNSIALNENIPDELIKKWITDSYNEVVKKLTKKQKEQLKNI